MTRKDDHPLGLPSEPAAPEPREEPPTDSRGRYEEWVSDHDTGTRDSTPALGTPGGPASWRPGAEDSDVALARPAWGDAGWSYLFGHDTRYGDAEPEQGEVAAVNRRMRAGAIPDDPTGPIIKPPVWTWEGPLYMWVGGIAAGSSFAALAADLSGDEWSASVARRVALGAVLPAPALLIADLGRPARFLNMLRIFKPRSPMNIGAWCLTAFSTVGAGAVGADVLGKHAVARGLGATNAVLGGYLGSYTGVLLATTAVPVWARSRIFLGPIFVFTATATGAAATRLAIVATGRRPVGHPTRVALNRMSAGAMLAELTLSMINQRSLGRAGRVLSEGRSGRLFRTAKLLAGTGMALNALGARRAGALGQHAASVMYLAAGLAFRYAWVEAGKASARDAEAVALMARGNVSETERQRQTTEQRSLSEHRPPRASRAVLAVGRTWSNSVLRASLFSEGLRRQA